MGGIILVKMIPAAADYCRWREAVGWARVDEGTAARGLAPSLYSICAVVDGEIAGYGRVVGDGAVYFYIQDVIVLPPYRLLGVGPQIMDAIMAYIAAHARPGSFVGLMADKRVAPFYERYGFRPRPPGMPGMGLLWPPHQGDEAK